MKPGDLVTLSHGNPLSKDYFFVYLDSHQMTADYPHFTVPEETTGLLVELTHIEGRLVAQVLFPQGVGWINSVWLEPIDRKEIPP